MITTLARYQVRKEELPHALAAVKAFVDEVGRKEGGTASYKAYQGKEDPTRFTHVMTFRTPSAQQYHQKTAWHKRFFESLAPMCATPPAFEEVAEVPVP